MGGARDDGGLSSQVGAAELDALLQEDNEQEARDYVRVSMETMATIRESRDRGGRGYSLTCHYGTSVLL